MSQASSPIPLNKPPAAAKMTDAVYQYVLDHNAEPEVMGELRRETNKMKFYMMQTAPEQARFMSWLMETMQAKRALEVGVFTGYSSLAVAMALPDDGAFYAIDCDEKAMEVARRYWKKANITHKVHERLGKGVAELERLLKEEGEGSFDFAFIDADKVSYSQYYEIALKLLRVGGIIGVDNTLWNGKVANPQEGDEATRCICELNDKIVKDPRVSSSMLQIGDGFTLARKL